MDWPCRFMAWEHILYKESIRRFKNCTISFLFSDKYFRQRNFFLRFKYKSYWKWHSYQRLRRLMISDFLSWIPHGWVETFQDSLRTVFTFRSWLDLLGVVLAFWISILKISKLLQIYWHRVIDITSFEKHLESSLDHTLNFCRNLVIFRSKNICQKESLTRSSTVI